MPADANSLFKVTFRKDYFSALGMIKRRLTYKSQVLSDVLKSNLDLTKFQTNLKSINLNELDVYEIEFEKSALNECDVLFAFSARQTSVKYEDHHKDLSKAHPKANHASSTESIVNQLNASYGHLILIYFFLNESETRELMSKCDQLFLISNRMTILLCPAFNPINNPALYEKIKLICNNFKAMLGQLIQI